MQPHSNQKPPIESVIDHCRGNSTIEFAIEASATDQRLRPCVEWMSDMAALLSDEELSALAYVRREYVPSFAAVLVRTYPNPPEVLFATNSAGRVLIGEGGFFVSRSGEICQFGSGQVFQ